MRLAGGALEALVLAVLRAAGIELPGRQEWIGGTTAPAGRVDFVFREARVVIEADSRRYYSTWLTSKPTTGVTCCSPPSMAPHPGELAEPHR